MTARELRQANAAYEAAQHASEEARRRRCELVREALREGWTQQRIADAMGLTRGRINQIAQLKTKPPATSAGGRA